MKKYSSLTLSLVLLGALCNTTYAYNIPELIDHDITIKVPGDVAELCFCQNNVETVQGALSCLSDKIIAPGFKVTIEIVKNLFNQKSIKMEHPDGDKINIIGNCPQNENNQCTITFQDNQSGIVAGHSHAIGLLDNLNLIGQNPVDSYGIEAFGNSTIQCGKNITVQGFFTGISARHDSSIFADNNVSQGNSYGFEASFSSSMRMEDAAAFNNSISGVQAIYGSSIHAMGATVKNNAKYGLSASFTSNIVCENALVKGNKQDFYNSSGSYFNCVVP